MNNNGDFKSLTDKQLFRLKNSLKLGFTNSVCWLIIYLFLHLRISLTDFLNKFIYSLPNYVTVITLVMLIITFIYFIIVLTIIKLGKINSILVKLITVMDIVVPSVSVYWLILVVYFIITA